MTNTVCYDLSPQAASTSTRPRSHWAVSGWYTCPSCTGVFRWACYIDCSSQVHFCGAAVYTLHQFGNNSSSPICCCHCSTVQGLVVNEFAGETFDCPYSEYYAPAYCLATGDEYVETLDFQVRPMRLMR